ncbi:MAG: ATP-binding protein [Candidatus Rokubacteria bacterium 13_1_40CM_2_68_8]|nr:MAG: ATP-binding protein [Actinobacteria bacterium 13_1_40CM_4_65_12]OLD39801.1 MAG: ATP-binding protein [Candidatus Rokubacteria bacterium 13_1_40CM_2_68_8]
MKAQQLSVRVPIRHESDVAMARKRVREMARRQGLEERAVEALATAVSEVARNIVVHAGLGELLLDAAEERGRRGVVVIARDGGPGIPDLEMALRDGYSSAEGLGLGLSSARRLVDEFEIISTAGQGTTVTLKKWAGARSRDR